MRRSPAARRSRKRPASTELGFASSVISISGAGSHRRCAVSITNATVAGGISDGVPPPKKMLPSGRRPVAAAQ